MRALIVQFKPEEAAPLAALLDREGIEASVYANRGAGGFRGIRENPPDVILIDLRSMPSYGRAMGALLRESKSLRSIPLVFLEGDPAKSAQVRQMLPDAAIAPWRDLGAALRRAFAKRSADPALPVPPDTPLYSKLKIRPGCVVALLHPPRGIRAVLGALPEGVRFEQHVDDASLILLFVKSVAALGKELPQMAALMRHGRTLWILWPKQASTDRSDLTMPGIRDMCRPYGLVDSKVCAVDETWSAMAFSRRR